MASDLDPRLNAFRPDLADAGLQTQVQAANYVNAQMRQCLRGLLPLRVEPRGDSPVLSEVHYGEFLDVFEEKRADGYAWVQSRNDRMVGYVSCSEGDLRQDVSSLSHRIAVNQALVFHRPSHRAPILDRLFLGSYVHVSLADNGFLLLASGGYLFQRTVDLSERVHQSDYVETAGRLLQTPYLAGGRTVMGIDDSGLVQLSLELAGIECPRTVDLQKEAFCSKVPLHWRDFAWRRGDLVFFANHVGLISDPTHMIHASLDRLCVTVDPLVDLVSTSNPIVGMARFA